MHSNFLNGFAAELEKTAVSVAVKNVRALYAQGNIAKAEALAKKRGTFSKSKLKPLEHRDAGKLVAIEAYPGSQLKHLGAGQEQMTTAVAHPLFGIKARKVTHGTTQATKDQMEARLAVQQAADGDGVAKAFGKIYHTPNGRMMTFHEIVPGTTSTRALKDLEARGQPTADMFAAMEKAKDKLKSAAAKAGMVVGDLGSQMQPSDNIHVWAKDGKWHAKVVDFNAARTKDKLRQVAPAGGRGVSSIDAPNKLMAQAFGPKQDQLARTYEKSLSANTDAMNRARILREEGDAMRKAMDRAPAPKIISPAEAAMEEWKKKNSITRVPPKKSRKK